MRLPPQATLVLMALCGLIGLVLWLLGYGPPQ